MVKRTGQNYLNELIDLSEKLHTFVSFIKNGKPQYYKEISIKLRILYVDKSGEKCLLRKICQAYGFSVPVAIRYTAKEKVEKGIWPPSLAEGLVVEDINSVVSWLESGDEIIDVFDALEREEILINGRMYSYKKIIEFAADKLGGAHIDENLPDEDYSLHSPNFPNRWFTNCSESPI